MIAGKPNNAPRGYEDVRPRLLELLLSRSFCSYWIALVLAIAFGTLGSAVSRIGRLANKDLSPDGFPDAYLMFSKTRPHRGYLVRRHDSTIRRSHRKVRGETWEVSSTEETDGVEYARWLLRSESGRTLFAVPVSFVADWDYPCAYEFVAQEYPELPLPQVTWTQLYVNRVYRGLYLLMELPYDAPKSKGGVGVRRELCSVAGDRMTIVDTTFRSETRLYADCIANGVFPQLAIPATALAWLDARRPTVERILVLENREPYNVSLLPLPLSLIELFEAFHSRRPDTVVDERYAQWRQRIAAGARTSPFDQRQEQKFEKQLAEYKARFAAALEVDQSIRAGFVKGASSASGKTEVGVNPAVNIAEVRR